MVDVMQLLEPVGRNYQTGDFLGGLRLLGEIWSHLPEPKAVVPNAYMIVEYGVAFAFKNGDMNEAWEWADRAKDFRVARQDRGEVEFLVGRVAYEDSKFELATEHFREAHRKSRGRLFSGADPKYLALIK